MNVTNDIVKDLATLVLAGEASPDSRRLVEEYARTHPEIQAVLNQAAQPLIPQPAAPDRELLALNKVKRFLFLRTLFTAMGVAFTLLPFTFIFDKGEIRFLVLPHSGLVWAFLSVAAASWVAMWMMRREVRKAGL